MKVKFIFNGCYREETVMYDNGTEDEEIVADASEWADQWVDQFLSYSYEILED